MATDPTPFPPGPPAGPARTARRIIVEAVVVALVGAFIWGLLWDVGQWRYGLIAAIVIWIAGAPLLEFLRVMRAK
jgi:MFS-type transporter involved in bile tolerance (Atg22 family)